MIGGRSKKLMGYETPEVKDLEGRFDRAGGTERMGLLTSHLRILAHNPDKRKTNWFALSPLQGFGAEDGCGLRSLRVLRVAR